MRKYIALLFVGLIALACAKNKTGSSATGGGHQTPAVKAGDQRPKGGSICSWGTTANTTIRVNMRPGFRVKLFKSGINMSYTVDPNDLNPENLKKYDGLIIYANHDSLSPSQESAMKAFVEGGKGLDPASFGFRLFSEFGLVH
jgi:hypothetical protein